VAARNLAPVSTSLTPLPGGPVAPPLDITAFRFAHTLAEACDLLAFLSIGMGIAPKVA